jgi:uncharacterized membrane protein YcaP (DUF421 family)
LKSTVIWVGRRLTRFTSTNVDLIRFISIPGNDEWRTTVNTFKWLFGEGSDLEIWQMTARAVAVFFLTLLLIRASGRRSFGQHTPFDACATVLLGAVLSRAVVGASPFWAAIASAAALAVTHRLLAQACIRWARLDDLVSGREIELVRDGRVDPHAMRRALLTQNNLWEAVRQKLGMNDISVVALALLERDGHITVLRAEHQTSREFTDRPLGH